MNPRIPMITREQTHAAGAAWPLFLGRAIGMAMKFQRDNVIRTLDAARQRLNRKMLADLKKYNAKLRKQNTKKLRAVMPSVIKAEKDARKYERWVQQMAEAAEQRRLNAPSELLGFGDDDGGADSGSEEPSIFMPRASDIAAVDRTKAR